MPLSLTISHFFSRVHCDTVVFRYIISRVAISWKMRNVLIVVVFSCIGLSYEFIVPFKTLKKNNHDLEHMTGSILEDEDVKLIILPSDSNNSKLQNLESSQNRIKENELYDQSNDRQTNVNERSLIFINQKFWSPLVNQLFSPDFLTDTKSLIRHETINHTPENNPMLHLNFKKVYSPTYIQTKAPTLSAFIPIEVTPEDLDRMNVIISKSYTAAKKGDYETTPYIELPKPPTERSTKTWKSNYLIDNGQYDNNNGHSFMSYYSNNLRKSPINPVIYEPDNNGVPTPFGQRSNKPEDIEIITNNNNLKSNNNDGVIKPNGNVHNVTNIIIKKLLKENDEVYKLLDRYLADSLPESESNEQLNAKHECTHNQCKLKTEKAQMKEKPDSENNCKCGRSVSNKIARREKANEIGTLGYTKTTTEKYLLPKSSEVFDYGEHVTTSDEVNNIEQAVKDLLL